MEELTKDYILRMQAAHGGTFLSFEVYPILAKMEADGLIKRKHPEINADMIEWIFTDAGKAAAKELPG